MNKVKDDDDFFEEYMGLVYYKIIKEYNLEKIDNVIEFAPGFRYKIAYALRRLNFKGNLYIIDSNKNVLDFIKKKYQEILPDVKIILINKDLKDSIDVLPVKASLFLANHSIDDMIISKYLDGKKLKEAFDNTEQSKEILIRCWNELKDEDDKLFKIREKVYNDIKKIFDNIDIDLIVMSQYKSAYYMNQKNYVEELSKVIFERLKLNIKMDIEKIKKALDFEFADFDAALNNGFSLKDNIQFYDNWIVGKYRRK